MCHIACALDGVPDAPAMPSAALGVPAALEGDSADASNAAPLLCWLIWLLRYVHVFSLAATFSYICARAGKFVGFFVGNNDIYKHTYLSFLTPKITQEHMRNNKRKRKKERVDSRRQEKKTE